MRKVKISYTTKFSDFDVEYISGWLFLNGHETFKEIEDQVVQIIAEDVDEKGYVRDDVVDYKFKVSNNTEQFSFTEQCDKYVPPID